MAGMSMGRPFIIDTDGARTVGNTLEAIPSSRQGAFEKLRLEPYPEGRYVDFLADESNASRIITDDEVAAIMALHREGDSVWEPVKDYGNLKVDRYHDRSLFSGCLFGRLTAHLPHATKEHVAHCVMNFAERAKWDATVAGFDAWKGPAGNDVMRFRIHAPPFYDRDFVTLHVLALCDGAGILTYQRFAMEELSPPSSKEVRGKFGCIATLIRDHPDGGVFFRSATVMDPKIPFLPKWLINTFIPMEFNKWIGVLSQRCAEMQKSGITAASLPCAKAFNDYFPPPEGMPAASPIDLKPESNVPGEGESKDRHHGEQSAAQGPAQGQALQQSPAKSPAKSPTKSPVESLATSPVELAKAQFVEDHGLLKQGQVDQDHDLTEGSPRKGKSNLTGYCCMPCA
mmetsp:Transcript_71523/g.155383  ORF Transcript_71523/g.155383 Transcript_71523/m.155383 type:complete len:399 (-) Transcript_71523:12-1208(-)